MQWDRDKVLMELSEFSFSGNSSGRALDEYRHFYELDFSKLKIDVDYSVGWVAADDFKVVLQTFRPANSSATVFVFHGYFDHAGIYHHLIAFLLTLGFSVVVYDMPGHGLSSGRPTSISKFEQYQRVLDEVLAVCRGNVPAPYHAVGQSTGGAVLVDRLSRDQPDRTEFDKIVLLAPLVRPKGWKGISHIHSLFSPFLKVWRRSFSINSNDVKFLEFLKEHDPLQSKWLAVDWLGALKEWIVDLECREPVQKKLAIVQGTADKTVDWQHNIAVIKSLFLDVKVCYVEGGHHHLVNEELTKREAVFQLLKAELLG